MSVIEPGSRGATIIARVKEILLRPGPTWDVIDGEAATVADLYKTYIIPLAAIPAICGLVGGLVFGYGAFGIVFRPSILSAIAGAIVQFGLGLAHVFVLGLIIDALAPSFGGTKSPIQAFKVATYSMTASWLAGAFGLVPALAILGIAGLYSLYLLYLGLPKLMKVAEDRALAYVALVIVAGLVLALIVGAVVGSVGRLGAPMSFGHLGGAGGTVSGELKTPAGAVDIGKLQAAASQMEAASKSMQSGKVNLTDPEILKGYLPGSVAGFSRTAVRAESGGAGGVGASNAEGDYTRGDARLKLGVSDMGAVAGLAAMAGAFNVHSSEESDGHYTKVGRVGGRMTTETYEQANRHGEYSVIVGDRFMIHADGDGVTMDDLKAAVGAINAGQLEGLAKAG